MRNLSTEKVIEAVIHKNVDNHQGAFSVPLIPISGLFYELQKGIFAPSACTSETLL